MYLCMYVGVLRYNTEVMGRFNPLFWVWYLKSKDFFLVMKLYINFSWIKDFGAGFSKIFMSNPWSCGSHTLCQFCLQTQTVLHWHGVFLFLKAVYSYSSFPGPGSGLLDFLGGYWTWPTCIMGLHVYIRNSLLLYTSSVPPPGIVSMISSLAKLELNTLGDLLQQ